MIYTFCSQPVLLGTLNPVSFHINDQTLFRSHAQDNFIRCEDIESDLQPLQIEDYGKDYACKKLSSRFRVVRGSVVEEILNAGKDSDLLKIGKAGRSLPGFTRFGSIVRNEVVRRPGMTLVWHFHGSDIRPVILLYDSSESAEKTLFVALSLQEVQESGLIVYLVEESLEKGPGLRLEVSDKLKELGVRATFGTLVRPDFKNLSWMLISDNAGPVVLPCNQKVSPENIYVLCWKKLPTRCCW